MQPVVWKIYLLFANFIIYTNRIKYYAILEINVRSRGQNSLILGRGEAEFNYKSYHPGRGEVEFNCDIYQPRRS
jgi:hypothetical protein